jgi:hypothetical protein
MKRNLTLITAAICALTLTGVAQAQTIDRMKMTDGDLTCQQMVDEIKLMDMMAAQAATAPAAAPQAAAPDNNVGAQVAGAVAQQAVAQAAARGGFGGFGGFGGSAGSALGGLFGGLAQAAATQPAAPPPQAAPAGNPMLAQQAAARKEHLTGLFLSKGCKMSNMR